MALLDDGTVVPSLYGLLDGSESAQLNLSTSFGGSEFGPSMSELMRWSSTGRVIFATEDPFLITPELCESKIILLAFAAGLTAKLPLALGFGARYTFMVGVVSTAYIITTAQTADTFAGMLRLAIDNSTTKGFLAGAGNNQIAPNGTTTGFLSIGDRLDLVDILPGVWAVQGFLSASGTIATPFSTQTIS